MSSIGNLYDDKNKSKSQIKRENVMQGKDVFENLNQTQKLCEMDERTWTGFLVDVKDDMRDVVDKIQSFKKHPKMRGELSLQYDLDDLLEGAKDVLDQFKSMISDAKQISW